MNCTPFLQYGPHHDLAESSTRISGGFTGFQDARKFCFDPIGFATGHPMLHVSLHRHPETSLEVVEETLLILQESQYYFLLELVDSYFCCGNLHGLEHRNKFVYLIVMLQLIVSFSCNMVFMMIR